MRELVNLAVDLDERFEASHAPPAPSGIAVVPATAAGERTLAWIDDEFGGAWSSEAHAGSNAIAYRGDAPVAFATYDARGFGYAWLEGLAREHGVGIFGPFGVARGERGAGLGRTILWHALSSMRARGFARACIAAVGTPELIQFYGETVNARVAERFDRAALLTPLKRAVVMASGSGTNFQAVLDRARDGALPLNVVALVCNNPGAYAIERARAAEVAVEVMAWQRKEESRERYDARLLEAVRAHEPDVVLLLGWMHLLGEPFVAAFPNLLNVHPAFLPLDPARDDVVLPDGSRMPAYRGPRSAADALAAGASWIGATVHLVTPETDRGPVLTRKPLRVAAGETLDGVMARLHPIEHQLVAAAILRRQYERWR
ncbi:MAG: hypothetical protein JO199_00840 [Candidatus Eremiobacteraeota bacterium]|nr:hypothetical protein [Candidatus Eremiobacteraeota bacterium]